MREMTDFEKLVVAAFDDCLTDPFQAMSAGSRFEALMMNIENRLRAIEDHPALSVPPLQEVPFQ